MGRKSKLSDEQWRVLGERLMAGEVAANLSREYGVPKSSISERFAEQMRTVRNVAQKVADVQAEVATLPPAQRRAVNMLADKLLAISEKMAGGAEMAASTFVGLKSIANAQFLKIDPMEPFKDADSILAFKTLGALTDMANKVAITPMNLLAANREAFKHGDSEGAGVIRLVNDPLED